MLLLILFVKGGRLLSYYYYLFVLGLHVLLFYTSVIGKIMFGLGVGNGFFPMFFPGPTISIGIISPRDLAFKN